MRSCEPQTTSSGAAIASSVEGVAQLGQQPAPGRQVARDRRPVGVMGGEELDHAGLDGALVAEGQRAVDAPDALAHHRPGQRDGHGEQRAQQRIALDQPEPRRHVEAGRRDGDDALEVLMALGRPQRHACRPASCPHTTAPSPRSSSGGVGHRVELGQDRPALQAAPRGRIRAGRRRSRGARPGPGGRASAATCPRSRRSRAAGGTAGRRPRARARACGAPQARARTRKGAAS